MSPEETKYERFSYLILGLAFAVTIAIAEFCWKTSSPTSEDHRTRIDNIIQTSPLRRNSRKFTSIERRRTRGSLCAEIAKTLFPHLICGKNLNGTNGTPVRDPSIVGAGGEVFPPENVSFPIPPHPPIPIASHGAGHNPPDVAVCRDDEENSSDYHYMPAATGHQHSRRGRVNITEPSSHHTFYEGPMH